MFEELGFTYFGPIDGHNITELCDAFEKARSLNEPVLIHVLTKKGKGYKNAEKDPGKFHGIGPFDPTTGALLNKSEGYSFSSLMGKLLCEKASDDQKIVAITAAMCEGTGLDDFSTMYPDRFFDVGIAEEHAVSFAAGLAKEGMKPVVCIYSSFLQRAYDQIMEDVCLQKLPVVFAIDRAGCVGADGETHHGNYDLSYLATIPGMTILTPKDGTQLSSMLDYALNLGRPAAIRYPKGAAEYNNKIMSTFDGKNIRICSGKGAFNIDIWACGNMFSCGQQVRNILADKGIEAGLVDVATVKPLDISPLSESESQPDMIVTIEDNSVAGGFGAQLASKLAGSNIRVMELGWPDDFIPQGTCSQLSERYGLTPESIAERICEEVEKQA